MDAGFDLTDAQWQRLAGLRRHFLDGEPGADYWDDEELVRLYDATFGARIRWKWEEVFAEAARRGFAPGPRVLDIGCGSGVAARAFLAAFGTPATELALWDRSAVARRTAVALADEERSRRGADWGTVRERHAPPTAALAPDVVLVSHVLGELTPADADALLEVLEGARAIAWVEPGTPRIAERLVRARERLRERFEPIAPCPHASLCGMLRPGRERDWCHLFATPAPEAFTSAHWRRFADALGIDLRSLPLAYLVLVRREAAPARAEGALARPLGRPKLEKGRALLDLCTEPAVVRARMLERDDRALAKRLASRRPFHPLLRVELDGDRLRSAMPVDGSDGAQ